MGSFDKQGDYYYFKHNPGLLNESIYYRMSTKKPIHGDQDFIIK